MEYYGIMAEGTFNAGASDRWIRLDAGVPEVFTSKAEAEAKAVQYNKFLSPPHLYYCVKEMEPEFGKNALREMEKVLAAKKLDAMLNVIGRFENSRHLSERNRITKYDSQFDEIEAKPGVTDEQIAARYDEVFEIKLEREKKRIEAAIPDDVQGYEITRAVCFSNNRGFALAENPRAMKPYAIWQFSEENGKRDYYWGHRFADEDSAVNDYDNRVDEYKLDYPTLTEKYNYLASDEISAEQNCNMIDGVINNLPSANEPPYIDGCNIASACNSRFEGMIAFVGMDDKVYLGKTENYDSRGNYDNSDSSLVYISDNKQTYHFLYSDGQYSTQAEALHYGFTIEDYAEFARIQAGVLAGFIQIRDFLFDGKPFMPPDSEAFREQAAALEVAGGAKPFWDMVAERVESRTEAEPGKKPSATEKLEAAKAEVAKRTTPKESASHKSKGAEL